MRSFTSLLTLLFIASFSWGQESGRARSGRSQSEGAVTLEQNGRKIVLKSGAARSGTTRVPSHPHGTIFWTAKSKDQHRTKQAAKQDALHEARERLTDYLRQVRPETQWRPSLKDVESLILGEPRLTSMDLPEPVETVYSASLDFALDPSTRDEMLRHIRLEGSHGRLWLMAKVLLSILALLGTSAGYFRLDDSTKGYYTNWLRAAAVAILGLAGVGISVLP